ncbi:MAG: GHMP kinase [Bryobacterales bacterium]|jgi:glucuronokinase|nr:GHMP kinase [Bryobacterales bacterium]
MYTSAIETYAYARAGLLGNPSDGYYGKTISFIVRNFRARVVLYPSARLEIRPAKADMPVFENLDDLYEITRWRGYYGGIRIIQALLVRLIEYAKEGGIQLHDRNFTLEYESTIPLRLGMGGSSAIITAALRALMEFYRLDIPKEIQAKLILETETRELNVSAGPQDRVIQVYEGLVYMDFDRQLMDSRGYGDYQALDPALLPNIYVAYRTSLSEGTEVFHNNVRGRWNAGESAVVDAMRTWAGYAQEGREALVNGDTKRLGELINANFDLRTTIYQIGEGNLEMIRRSRAVGATSNFAGSGGAIVGAYEDEEMFSRLQKVLAEVGVNVLKPRILP